MRLLLFILPTLCLAQGWTQLANTTFGSVSTPNSFTSTYMGHTMPSYAFADNHYRILTQWGSAWSDTKRGRKCFWGGGHNGPNDNSIQCLDLVTASSTSATCGGQSCNFYSNCSGSPCSSQGSATVPTMTRLNDPSVYINSCPTGTYDGTPPSMQDWGALIYLPKHDKYWMASNATACPDNLNQSWWFDPAASCSTATCAASWTQLAGAITNDSNNGKRCAYNPTTADETVVCIIAGNTLDQYDATTNAWSHLANGTLTIQNAASIIVDPDRQVVYSIGTNFDSSSPAIYQITLAGAQTTLTTTGCTNLKAYTYPSLEWDPTLHRVVYYVPVTAASPTVAANIIGIFDPATMTCVEQPQLGGSGPPSTQISTPPQGTFAAGLSYFPALNEYVVMNAAATSPATGYNVNAYTFKLNVTPTNGLGSSTLTCVDRDGDGYGVGSGCTGPDADDQDSAVHTSAQFISKWTDIPTGLKHLGYSPANIWYVATTGNDGTGAVNNPALPFATCCGGGKANPAAGDAVLLRGGTYSFFSNALSGSAGSPIIFMNYPGELAYFATNPSGFDLLTSNWVVEDGMRYNGTGGNACIAGGSNTHLVLRHVEAYNCEWGIDAGGDLSPSTPLSDLAIEDSSLHDAGGVGGQHGIYLTCHGGVTCPNIFVRRNLLYNNNYTGVQLNGKLTNAVVDQNITYSNLTTGISITEGVSNSFFRSNLSLNDAKALQIFSYDGNDGLSVCGAGLTSVCNCTTPNFAAICAFDSINNLIENFSAYLTGTDGSGMANAGTTAIGVGRSGSGTCTTTKCVNSNLGSNTFRNIVLQTNNTAGGGTSAGDYPPIQFPDSTGVTYLSTTTFDSIVTKNLAYTGVIGYGPGMSFGYTPYTCAQLAMMATSTNCTVADPQFVAASTSYWSSPASLNLKLLTGSPAVSTGSATLAPAFDNIGAAFSVTAPNMGALTGSQGASGGISISGGIKMSGNITVQ